MLACILGNDDGNDEGTVEIEMDGNRDGALEGNALILGSSVGYREGAIVIDGRSDGSILDNCVESAEGTPLGISV